jgi:hypothetical protein
LDLAKLMLGTSFFTSLPSCLALFGPYFSDDFVVAAHDKAVQGRNKAVAAINAILAKEYIIPPPAYAVDLDDPAVPEAFKDACRSLTAARAVWNERAVELAQVSL